ncbi:MAG: hypothetical protein ACXVBJ_10680 [Flavisolibacter sp.]
MLKADETSGNIFFEETQQYPRWIGWIVAVSMIVTIVALLIALVTDKEKTDIRFALIIIIPVAILVIYLTSIIKLQKLVTSNGLYFRWKPLHRRFRVIEKEDIASFVGRRFPFLSYGSGWFPTYGWYYNFSRGEGVQLYLKNGRRFFFSTSNREAFERAIEKLISSNPKAGLREL